MKAPGPPPLPNDHDRPNLLLLAFLVQEALLLHAALKATEPDSEATTAAAVLVHKLHTLNAGLLHDIKTRLRQLNDRTAAGDEIVDERNEHDHKQNMNDSAADVIREPEHPQHEEHDDDRPKDAR